MNENFLVKCYELMKRWIIYHDYFHWRTKWPKFVCERGEQITSFSSWEGDVKAVEVQPFLRLVVWKLNRAISSLFSQLETRSTRLEFNFEFKSFEFRVTVNLHLNGTVHVFDLEGLENHFTWTDWVLDGNTKQAVIINANHWMFGADSLYWTLVLHDVTRWGRDTLLFLRTTRRNLCMQPLYFLLCMRELYVSIGTRTVFGQDQHMLIVCVSFWISLHMYWVNLAIFPGNFSGNG